MFSQQITPQQPFLLCEYPFPSVKAPAFPSRTYPTSRNWEAHQKLLSLLIGLGTGSTLMDPSDKYQYSSLGENQLRLLRPVHELSSRDLKFTVCHVSRDEATKYTAVSYAWGDESPTETIQLDGKVFLLGPTYGLVSSTCPGHDQGYRLTCSGTISGLMRYVSIKRTTLKRAHRSFPCTTPMPGLK